MMTYLDYNTLRMADSLNDYFDKIEKNDYFFDVVKSVESTGVKDTYDIEVDIDHHFVSGGIICSNSQGMTLDSVYVNMTRAFEIGQVYTALSRCKSIGGLYLKSVPNDDMIALSDKIASFMERCEENGGTFRPESVRDLPELQSGSGAKCLRKHRAACGVGRKQSRQEVYERSSADAGAGG